MNTRRLIEVTYPEVYIQTEKVFENETYNKK